MGGAQAKTPAEPKHVCEFCGSWRPMVTGSSRKHYVVVCKNQAAGCKWMVQTGPGESCGAWHPQGTKPRAVDRVDPVDAVDE